MNDSKTLYYPVWISPGRKAGGWSFGEPCDTPSSAVRIVKERIAAGASLGCVVQFRDGKREPMMTYIWPLSARKTIAHWEKLWNATEPEETGVDLTPADRLPNFWTEEEAGAMIELPRCIHGRPKNVFCPNCES